jgi:hypothetical protein
MAKKDNQEEMSIARKITLVICNIGLVASLGALIYIMATAPTTQPPQPLVTGIPPGTQKIIVTPDKENFPEFDVVFKYNPIPAPVSSIAGYIEDAKGPELEKALNLISTSTIKPVLYLTDGQGWLTDQVTEMHIDKIMNGSQFIGFYNVSYKTARTMDEATRVDNLQTKDSLGAFERVAQVTGVKVVYGEIQRE